MKRELAEERAKYKRARAIIADYQRTHKRLVDLVVKELELPTPPANVGEAVRAQKTEDAAALGDSPKKKARIH